MKVGETKTIPQNLDKNGLIEFLESELIETDDCKNTYHYGVNTGISYAIDIIKRSLKDELQSQVPQTNADKIRALFTDEKLVEMISLSETDRLPASFGRIFPQEPIIEEFTKAICKHCRLTADNDCGADCTDAILRYLKVR